MNNNQQLPKHLHIGAHIKANYKVGKIPININDGIIIQVISVEKKNLSYVFYTVYDLSSDSVYTSVNSLACSWVVNLKDYYCEPLSGERPML